MTPKNNRRNFGKAEKKMEMVNKMSRLPSGMEARKRKLKLTRMVKPR